MFERSQKTLRLLDLFRATNGTLSYDRIETETGESIADLRQTLANVRRYLERDEGIVFACVRKQGYRRLSDSEKIESARGFTRKIRRAAVAGETRLGTVSDLARLPPDEQLRHTLQARLFEAIRTTTGEQPDPGEPG